MHKHMNSSSHCIYLKCITLHTRTTADILNDTYLLFAWDKLWYKKTKKQTLYE